MISASARPTSHLKRLQKFVARGGGDDDQIYAKPFKPPAPDQAANRRCQRREGELVLCAHAPGAQSPRTKEKTDRQRQATLRRRARTFNDFLGDVLSDIRNTNAPEAEQAIRALQALGQQNPDRPPTRQELHACLQMLRPGSAAHRDTDDKQPLSAIPAGTPRDPDAADNPPSLEALVQKLTAIGLQLQATKTYSPSTIQLMMSTIKGALHSRDPRVDFRLFPEQLEADFRTCGGFDTYRLLVQGLLVKDLRERLDQHLASPQTELDLEKVPRKTLSRFIACGGMARFVARRNAMLPALTHLTLPREMEAVPSLVADIPKLESLRLPAFEANVLELSHLDLSRREQPLVIELDKPRHVDIRRHVPKDSDRCQVTIRW